MNYKYRAIDDNGKIIEETYNADNKEEVLNMIKNNDLFALSIEEDLSITMKSLLRNQKIKKRDLVIFCRLFYTMLNAGINISTTLRVLADNTINSKLKEGITEINEDIQKGMALSDAIEKQDKIFPDLFIEMVRAGEISGNLETIIHQLGGYYEKQNKIENKLKSSLIYPLLLIVMSIMVIVFMLAVVFPVFYSMFHSRELNLPLPTRILIFVSNFIRNKSKILIVLFIMIVLSLRSFYKTEKGQHNIANIKLKTPLFRKIYIEIVSANFTRTLSMLLSSGVPLIKSLEMVGKITNNLIIYNKLQIQIDHIHEGKSLSDALKSLEIFPSIIDTMVKVGEESGELDEVLLKTAHYYDEEVNIQLEKLAKLIEPMLMIIMGFIIGFIVISLALPMFDIMYDLN